MKDTWGKTGAQRSLGNISEEITSKRNGDEKTVPGRGTVCTAWSKALENGVCGEVSWLGPTSVKGGGMEAELRSQAGAREAKSQALSWESVSAILKGLE